MGNEVGTLSLAPARPSLPLHSGTGLESYKSESRKTLNAHQSINVLDDRKLPVLLGLGSILCNETHLCITVIKKKFNITYYYNF